MPWTPCTRIATTSRRPPAAWSPEVPYSVPMNLRHGHRVSERERQRERERERERETIFIFHDLTEEAKRFEDGLQEQKDFLYIQRKYVSEVVSTRKFCFE